MTLHEVIYNLSSFLTRICGQVGSSVFCLIGEIAFEPGGPLLRSVRQFWPPRKLRQHWNLCLSPSLTLYLLCEFSFFLSFLLMIIGKKKLSHMNVFPCLRSVSFLTALSPLNPTRSPFSTPINAYFTWVSWNLTLPTELPSLSFIYFSKLLLWFVRLVQSMYIFCQTQVNSVNHTPLGIGIFSVACVKVLSKIKIIWLRPASLQAKLIFLSFHGV